MPKGKWKFDEEVARCFDEMLSRSIPGYEDMRSLVFDIGRHFVKIGRWIADIGCSNGAAIDPFVHKYGEDVKYFMCDVSQPMLDKCIERFGNSRVDENFCIKNYDITKGLPEIDACLVLSILTLQFTPIEYRQKIVQSIYDRMQKGDAFILVEKVLGNTYELDNLFVDEYYKIKTENAYTQEQIATKRKSLEGVLVPITAKWNENLLKEVGFRQIDCFWRYLNFAGWIAIK